MSLPEDLEVAEALAMLCLAAVQLSKENPVEGETLRETAFNQIAKDLAVEDEDKEEMMVLVDLAIASHAEIMAQLKKDMS